jgi:hypothetical protein
VRASDNWQEGIPLPNYVKSLIRHTFEFWRMWRGHEVPNPDANGAPFTFEEVLSAIMFNVMGIIFEMRREGGSLHRTCYTKQFRQQLEQPDALKKAKPLPAPTATEPIGDTRAQQVICYEGQKFPAVKRTVASDPYPDRRDR